MPIERSTVSIFLVDDDSLIRAGLCALIQQDPHYEVVGGSGDARRAIASIGDLQPDVVLLDIQMPGLSGIDAVAPIRRAARDAKVLIASHHEGASLVYQALAAGAHGYLTKSSRPEELSLALESVLAGESYVTPRVASGLISRLHGDGSARGPGSALDALTCREREVLQMIVIGQANKQIAACLYISLSTVKKHRENLQRKLDCHSAAGLTRLVIREGLLTA